MPSGQCQVKVAEGGELVGIALMFAGFAFVGKQPAPRRRRPAPAPVAYSQKATPA